MNFDQQEFYKIREKFQDLKTERKYLCEELEREKEKKENLEVRHGNILSGRKILQIVAEATQKRLEKRISDLVSMALEVVFPDPYRFQLEFVKRRNKTECDVWFVKRGKKISSSGAGSGGGVKDVASFAAKLAFWSLRKTGRALIIADEPFKFLHDSKLQENCSEMLNELSAELKMQMILVSDQANIEGDKVFNIEELVGNE